MPARAGILPARAGHRDHVKSFRAVAVAAVTLMCARPAALAGQDAPALAVQAVRFWVPEYRQTLVKAFVQIPYIALTPTGSGPDGMLSYRVSVRVADSTDLTLMQQSWAKRAPGAARAPGVTGFEILEFAVAPGNYRLEITVDDSVSGAKLNRALQIQAFTDQPGASDLVLSPRMRIPSPEDTIPVPGELRRGNTIITASAEVRLAPLGERAKLYYYLEGYSERTDSGALQLEVRSDSGRTILAVPARPVRFGAGGGAIRGQLDLTGLPEGRYQLHAALAMGDRTLERDAFFRMGELATALAQENEQRAIQLLSDSGNFGAMNSQELEDAFAPLSLIATPEDGIAVWSPRLSQQARRNFLTGFWRNRDPSPGTPRNEAREAFYAKIAEANQRFADQQRGTRAGWQTDMGRIYIRNGEPNEVLRRAQIGLAPPYQVWRFSGAREKWYIFLDRTNFGGFELVASNDPKEASRPDWGEMVGPDGLNDIGSFLNMDFYRRDRR